MANGTPLHLHEVKDPNDSLSLSLYIRINDDQRTVFCIWQFIASTPATSKCRGEA